MSPILGIYASQISGHLWAPSGAYDSIATVTVGSGGAANVEFTSIPSTYTHLQIRGIARDASTSGSINMQFNTDTASNYSRHAIYGDGSGAYASAASTIAFVRPGFVATSSYGSNTFGAIVLDVLDYANTNKYKTMRSLAGVDNNGSGEMDFRSGLWQSTSAITSIKLYVDGGSNFAQYSSFALYGIK